MDFSHCATPMLQSLLYRSIQMIFFAVEPFLGRMNWIMFTRGFSYILRVVTAHYVLIGYFSNKSSIHDIAM